MNRTRFFSVIALSLMAMAAWTLPLYAQDNAASSGPSTANLKVIADTLWVLIAAFLVFFMNTGFGCVEAGFCRAKNATNILGKNFVVFAIASVAFWLVGFALMFGNGNPFFGTEGWVLSGADNSPATGDAYQGVFKSLSWTGVPLLAKFFFQLAFAGTAATIVSGCVAERIHYKSFMIFAVFVAAVSYPITGHWIWGGGWLAENWKFWDFAGSTVVHSVGGWAGLAGILLLGPRLGKFRANGTIQPIPGHSMALAFLGGMVLWLGWFGFNPGSTMAADPNAISHIVITTNMACAAGMLTATVLAWIILRNPDFSMTVNGALAGLVAITAPCAWVTQTSAVIIGVIAGILVVLAVLFFDRIRIDDPVGALSVHLVNGVWGTLAVGLFAVGGSTEAGALYAEGPAAGLFCGGGATQLIAQLIGVLGVGAFTFTGSIAVWAVIKAVVGIRVDREHEMAGLDVSEMGMEAYPGFQVADPIEYTSPILEPRPALVPPDGEKRYTVVVEGVLNGDLMDTWSTLCQPGATAPSEFKAIYPHMTTVQGNRFKFRGGDPEEIRKQVEDLFRDRLKSSIKAHVE